MARIVVDPTAFGVTVTVDPLEVLRLTIPLVPTMLHCTLPAELEGTVVAVMEEELPLCDSVKLLLFSERLAAVTVILQEADFPLPSWAAAVMVADPAATPVTIPLLTVATFVLLLDQEMFLLLAFVGEMAAVKVFASPTAMVALELEREIPVTGMETAEAVTVTAQVAV